MTSFDINYKNFYKSLEGTKLTSWLKILPSLVDQRIYESNNGNVSAWLDVLSRLPDIEVSKINISQDIIQVGKNSDICQETFEELKETLMELKPWRKGPYELFGVHVDAEWRSDMKWDRLKEHVQSLKGRKVLDVGCGNGYHCWRMLGEKAKLVVGVDPSLLFVFQYFVFQKYIQESKMAVLPIGVDDIPQNIRYFDTVFSMGLLYHRRSPLDHLLKLKSFLRPGGELVLETLIIDGKEGEVLMPEDRYALMPNVFFIPSIPTLLLWLRKFGFKDIVVGDISITTAEEQRATPWMGVSSLDEFLDPQDKSKTVEGYPAPLRAIVVAKS